MIERKIQTEVYWRQEFEVSDEDMLELADMFLDEHRPLTLSEMARSLIDGYCQREENLIRRQLAQGDVYRPNDSFEVGDTLVFPHLDFAAGTVVDIREGHNPEYSDFSVIAVELKDADGHEQREFAADLQDPHKLSFSDDASLDSMFALSPEMLFDSYGQIVMSKLAERLASAPDYVEFRGSWFPQAMTADIHIGLLNIAEALLVMQEKPLPPVALLPELDLPDEIPEEVQVFSLNTVISRDERFIDVGDEKEIVWALGRWLPTGAYQCPSRLMYEPVSYDRTDLDVTHLQLEREIDDETSRLVAPPTAADATETVLLLTYPHWRNGTLPLTARTEVFFPSGVPGQSTQITFIDRINDTQFPGWVVHEFDYVYGLADWYEQNEIPTGAQIKLVQTEEPHAVIIDVIPRRMQREWTRMITMTEEGELTFTMQKRPIACEYDDLLLVDEPDRTVGDTLWTQETERDRPLQELVTDVFLELAKLTPSVAVHAKTVYSSVNVIKRCPPGLVFATLFSVPAFITTGDAYWVYQGGA